MVRSRRTPTTVFCHFSEARAVTAPAETLISPKLLTARAVLLAALGHALGEGGKRDHPAPRPHTDFHAFIRSRRVGRTPPGPPDPSTNQNANTADAWNVRGAPCCRSGRKLSNADAQ